MNRISAIFAALAILAGCTTTGPVTDVHTLTSPSGNMEMTFHLNPDGTPQPPAHNVILCNLQDKRYFLDVGYGGPVPYRALELKEGLQDGFLLEKQDDSWYVTRVTEKETRPLICFRDIPVTVNDLIPLNFYISQRPDVHFRHVIHLSLRNADGSIYSLDGREFKIHGGNDTTIIPVDSIDKLKEILKTYFSIDPDTVPLHPEI